MNMFDYKRFSVLQYNQILSDWLLGKPPKDTNIFNFKVKSAEHNLQTLLITFDNNTWIKVDKSGWWCQRFNATIQDIVSDRKFFTKDRTSESLGLGHLAYTSRPSKGISYKNISIGGLEINRNGKRVSTNIIRAFYYNVEHFKKYTEHQFNTDCGLSFYEKVNKEGTVLKTVIRVKDNDDCAKTSYGLTIQRVGNGRRVQMSIHRDFGKALQIETKFKDCDVDNIYNKYTMFEFDLSAVVEEFEIVENVRTLLKKHIENTYKKIKEEGLNCTIISQVLKRIEVIEDDEYQIQRNSQIS